MLSPQVEGAETCDIGEGVSIGRNSRVTGRKVRIGSGTKVGDGVTIMADEVSLGRRCVIEDDVKVTWRGEGAERFAMGDCSFVGKDSQIIVREFAAGDYVVLHNHLLANGDGDLRIGDNSWVGQNGILNANAPLTIGKNVGIGAYSAVWTHGKFGALIDGCLMHKEAAVVIEDDACIWRSVVSPGVTVGRRSTVLPGSILTKNAPAGSCFGGVPAMDLSSKVKTYRNVSKKEQFQMMRGFAAEFLAKNYPGRHRVSGKDEYRVSQSGGESFRLLVKWKVVDGDLTKGERVLAVTFVDKTSHQIAGASVFDLSTRTYTKWFTEPEIKFMWFMNDSRARFSPSNSAHPSD